MTYFYQDSNGLFHIGNNILPAGKYILNTYSTETIVQVVSAARQNGSVQMPR